MAVGYNKEKKEDMSFGYKKRIINRPKQGFGRRFSGRPSRPKLNIADFIVRSQEQVSFEPETIKHSFADFGLSAQLLNNLERAGFSEPTPIQDKAMPDIIAGRDLIGLANTGTGKTASFLLPLIDKIAQDPTQKVLVIAPTRELAIQIDSALRSLKPGFKIWSVLAIGGTSTFRQMQDLRKPHEFVIGTPGRLKDMAERGLLRLEKFQTVVLDEVDRMLDMGFVPAIRELLSQLPDKRQSLFFSATMPVKIHELARTFMTNPVTVSVKTVEVTSQVEQKVVQVRPTEKVSRLVELLSGEDFSKVLVFGRTKRGVHKLMFQLRDNGFRVESIHGDKAQNYRKRALEDFRSNRVNILVATDVAARGLDIADITHVINYDMPETYEDYVHRIGRTGRAGKVGVAVTFVS